MTQLFTSNSSSSPNMAGEKRIFSHPSTKSSKQPGETSHFPTKLKNFFRISSSNHNNHHDGSSIKSDSKSSFKQSRFLPSIGRNRSTTTASEGNPLDEGMSPTAHANPYFVHQGMPALRHHNEGSVPSTPPDGAASKLVVPGAQTSDSAATTATKEELARKLRRVASAPNAQGMFSSGKEGERPKTAELGKEPLVVQQGTGAEAKPKISMVIQNDSVHLPVPSPDGVPVAPGFRNSMAFRRTYSSNSIKVRNVEVGPGSFDKIKLIGKGDVGKVYLVREKKSSRLFAMKGGSNVSFRVSMNTDFCCQLQF